MLIEAVFFYVLAAVLVGMGLVVITMTNPIASALAMVGAFVALAGLYAVLTGSFFLSAIQVLVYAGGIMVLIVFVIMLLNLGPEDLTPMRAKLGQVAMGLVLVLGGVLGPVWLLLQGSEGSEVSRPEGLGTIERVGKELFTRYLFPFEMLSLLLLTAVVGAIVLSKKKL